jgi:hypothetical protein
MKNHWTMIKMIFKMVLFVSNLFGWGGGKQSWHGILFRLLIKITIRIAGPWDLFLHLPCLKHTVNKLYNFWFRFPVQNVKNKLLTSVCFEPCMNSYEPTCALYLFHTMMHFCWSYITNSKEGNFFLLHFIICSVLNKNQDKLADHFEQIKSLTQKIPHVSLPHSFLIS